MNTTHAAGGRYYSVDAARSDEGYDASDVETDFLGEEIDFAEAELNSADDLAAGPVGAGADEDEDEDVDPTDTEIARDMLDFIEASPSMFHSAASICDWLDDAGFTYLPESTAWDLEPGGAYYTQRNGSSVIAWQVGEGVPVPAAGAQQADFRFADELDCPAYHFQVAASHADSPTFKVKAVPELDGAGESLRLNVEAYGGMIDYSWFDRPLGLAGRVLVREDVDEQGADGATGADGAADADAAVTPVAIHSRLLFIDRPVAIIPSLAIHMDREVNKGFAPNRQVDLCPLFSAGELKAGAFDALVARELGVRPDQVLARDLFLVNLQPAQVWGEGEEFVSSPRLDDLMCAYTSLSAFLQVGAPLENRISVYCCFDNEEVGSNTKQGAMSTLLRDTLERINQSLGFSSQDLRRALAVSFMVSCDNAHAVHPNRPERVDERNRCVLNGGLVIKEAANQAYCTDAFSRAVFAALLDRAGVPRQTFANKSDMAGGSTLGNLSNMQVSMHGVDVGCAQLAMHSSYETAGARDVAHAIAAFEAFYEADVHIDGAQAALLA